MKTQVTIDAKEVEQIVKQHLETKFKSVKKVEAVIGQEMRGYYQNEHYESVFKGVTCEVEV